MPVSIKGSGGGGVTLDAGAAASNTTLTLPNVSGTVLQSGTAVTVAQGGTGATTLTANNVLLGNGTSAVQFVAPGTSGNVLTSNGTTWTSAAPSFGSGPAFAASSSTTQSFGSGTWTKLSFTSEQFDTNNCYDNATNYRFTPTTAGYYQINLSLGANEAGSGAVTLYSAFYKNGVSYTSIANRDDNGQQRNLSQSVVLYCNGTTDYVEIYGYTNGGTYVAQQRMFSGSLVRSA